MAYDNVSPRIVNMSQLCVSSFLRFYEAIDLLLSAVSVILHIFIVGLILYVVNELMNRLLIRTSRNHTQLTLTFFVIKMITVLIVWWT